MTATARVAAHDPEGHAITVTKVKPTAEELAAFETAKPVFETHCFRCHTTAGKKAKPKALDHVKMDGYPFGGHHADMIGPAVRDVVKSKDGKDPTMPKDDPGAVKGADLDAILAWTGAWDRAHVPSRPDPALVAVIEAWHRALGDRSVAKLAAVVDEGLVVLEGTHKNVGWADFRDNHIGPEMKEWTEFKLIEGRVIEANASATLGYGVWEGVMRITAAGKPVTLQAAETFVFTKASGGWRIKHVQMAMKKVDDSASPTQSR